MISLLLQEELPQKMTNYEVATIVISCLAFLISLFALLASIKKMISDKKKFIINFITEHLIRVRDSLEKGYTELKDLDFNIRLNRLVKKLSNEPLDHVNEIYSLYRQFDVIHKNLLLWLSSYRPTQNTAKAISHLNQLEQYFNDIVKLATDNNKDVFIQKYIEYDSKKKLPKITSDEYNVVLEINNTISQLIKGKIIKNKDLDKLLYEIDWKPID